MKKPKQKASMNPLEWVFSVAGLLASAIGAVLSWATSNFFVLFAMAVFAIYMVVFHLFGK